MTKSTKQSITADKMTMGQNTVGTMVCRITSDRTSFKARR